MGAANNRPIGGKQQQFRLTVRGFVDKLNGVTSALFYRYSSQHHMLIIISFNLYYLFPQSVYLSDKHDLTLLHILVYSS